MIRMTLLAMLILVSAAARAQEPKAAGPDAPAAKMVEAPSATPDIAPVKATEPEAKAPMAVTKAAGEARPYVDAAMTFLKALTHSSRPGEEGELAWAAARANAADAVSLKVGGKDLQFDLAGKKSDAQLVRFHKLATLREGAVVKGVTLESVELRIGEDAHSGKATVRMDEKDGKWVVTAVEVE